MIERPPGRDTSLLRLEVRDLVRRSPVTCPPDLPIREAARLMDAEGVGSVVVVQGDAEPAGIVTVRDLRSRVVAVGRSADTSAGTVMSRPLATVRAGDPAFDALLLMTRQGIHHLGVVDAGRLVGVLGRDDFAALWLADPVGLVRDIDRAASLDALAVSAGRLTHVVRRLVEAGAGPPEVGAVVAEINDRLAKRVTSLAEGRLADEGAGTPPVPWCLLAAGSEGRREQALRTDQDTGLVYDDPPADLAEPARAYFTRLGGAIGEGLRRLGVPACTGGYMAENPRWCQPLAAWRRQVLQWLDNPSPPRLVEASVYLDMRPVAGEARLGLDLQAFAYAEAKERPLFLRFLAHSAVDRRPALGLFGGIRVARRGPHRGTVDLKSGGIFPMTQAMRVYALALGVLETNTLARLAGAAERGAFTPAEAADFRAAYLVILRLRLARQLEAVAAGQPPDNRIEPKRLNRVERVALVEAFRTLRWLQRHLTDRFQTTLVP